MHYLLIEPDKLTNILACTNLTTIEQASACVNNFVSMYSNVHRSDDISDLKQDAIDKLKAISGVSHPLKFKRLLVDVKNNQSNLEEDLNKQLKSILASPESYSGSSYLELKKSDCTSAIAEQKIVYQDAEMIKIRLSIFQERLLNYISQLYSLDDSLEFGVQDFNTNVEKIKMSFKTPKLWGKSLETIMNYQNQFAIFNSIESNLVDFQSKKLSVKLFKAQYLNDTADYFKNVIMEFIRLYPNVDKQSSNVLEQYLSRYIDDNVKWDFRRLNDLLGTSLNAYETLLEVVELQEFGFIGIWHNSNHTVEHLKSTNVLIRNQLNPKELLSNKNIRYIIDVLDPIIKGEIAYLQEV